MPDTTISPKLKLLNVVLAHAKRGGRLSKTMPTALFAWLGKELDEAVDELPDELRLVITLAYGWYGEGPYDEHQISKNFLRLDKDSVLVKDIKQRKKEGLETLARALFSASSRN